MGLCKCPKRKTTSHFCFHHCVNVCEHCIVNNHTTCVVKSYTTWLKEASGSVSSSTATASALCAVCQKQFVLLPKNVHNPTNSFNDRKTAIRLLCYHVVHAHCLSVYVKKQLKEGNTTKCPSCVRPLWLPDQLQESNDIAGPESNELSPVASQLHKHLLNHGDWWGQALITNGNVKDLEKYLLEDNDDDNDEHIDEQNQQLTDQSSFKIIKQPTNTVSNNTSPLAHTIQSTNSENSYYNNYDSSEILHTPSDVTTINHRSSTHQTYQPIHHRHFNNNYGIDSVYTPSQQQQLQQQSVNMTAVAQGSDLSNRHAITSSTTLLLNNDKNVINDEEQQDPSGKYRPKKFNNQSWSLSYKRLTQYISGNNNKTEDNGSTRIAIIIIVCVLIIVVLLVAITSYTRSSNEPFDSNSIDYGGEDDPNKNGGEANLKSYDTNL